MATPKKKATKKKPRVQGKHDKRKITANTYELKPDRYSITKAVGRPLKYDTAEALAAEIDAYFEYVKGEYGEQEITFRDAKTGKQKIVKQQVCIREPEPATITGLHLFLGFSSLDSLDDYKKRGPKFSEVVKMGRLRVAHKYERNLSGNTPTGSIFALKVIMGWKDSAFPLDSEVEGTIIGFKYVTPPKPNNDED